MKRGTNVFLKSLEPSRGRELKPSNQAGFGSFNRSVDQDFDQPYRRGSSDAGKNCRKMGQSKRGVVGGGFEGGGVILAPSRSSTFSLREPSLVKPAFLRINLSTYPQPPCLSSLRQPGTIFIGRIPVHRVQMVMRIPPEVLARVLNDQAGSL